MSFHSDIQPLRFALRFEPPTLVMEFQRSDGKKRVTKFQLRKLKHTSEPSKIVRGLQTKCKRYLSPSVVSTEQLTRLVIRLVNQLKQEEASKKKNQSKITFENDSKENVDIKINSSVKKNSPPTTEDPVNAIREQQAVQSLVVSAVDGDTVASEAKDEQVMEDNTETEKEEPTLDELKQVEENNEEIRKEQLVEKQTSSIAPNKETRARQAEEASELESEFANADEVEEEEERSFEKKKVHEVETTDTTSDELKQVEENNEEIRKEQLVEKQTSSIAPNKETRARQAEEASELESEFANADEVENEDDYSDDKNSFEKEEETTETKETSNVLKDQPSLDELKQVEENNEEIRKEQLVEKQTSSIAPNKETRARQAEEASELENEFANADEDDDDDDYSDDDNSFEQGEERTEIEPVEIAQGLEEAQKEEEENYSDDDYDDDYEVDFEDQEKEDDVIAFSPTTDSPISTTTTTKMTPPAPSTVKSLKPPMPQSSNRTTTTINTRCVKMPDKESPTPQSSNTTITTNTNIPSISAVPTLLAQKPVAVETPKESEKTDDDAFDDLLGDILGSDLDDLDYSSEDPLEGDVDLNKVDEGTLDQAKKNMNVAFLKNRVRPGDQGYEFDKRVDFAAVEIESDNSWDDMDESSGDEE
jgi:hypothetical protein